MPTPAPLKASVANAAALAEAIALLERTATKHTGAPLDLHTLLALANAAAAEIRLAETPQAKAATVIGKATRGLLQKLALKAKATEAYLNPATSPADKFFSIAKLAQAAVKEIVEAPPKPQPTQVVETSYGKVGGYIDADGSKARCFLGIPFAQCERFGAPTPPEKWEGVRDATKWGPDAVSREVRGVKPYIALILILWPSNFPLPTLTGGVPSPRGRRAPRRPQGARHDLRRQGRL